MARTPSAQLFVLCLDDSVVATMSGMPNTVLVTLKDVESYCPTLLQVKPLRKQPREYYTTMTAIFPLFLFDKFGMEKLTYTDADMSFWSSAEEIEEVMGSHSLMVTDHENPIAYAAGRFNNGIMGYRNDQDCVEFLQWYAERCLEWCEWHATADGKCGDQGYLTVLHSQPGRFKNVLSCPQPGINLGPWNLAMHTLEERGDRLVLDGDRNLVCYHFHGIAPDGRNGTGWTVSDANAKLLYSPYQVMRLRAQAGVL
jgi:hypothetical protein